MIPDRIAFCASDTNLSRRSFLGTSAAIGGGLMLSLTLPLGRSEAASSDSFAPNAFIRIGSDSQVVLTMPYVEMGQGTYTSIPMLIAEELDVSLKQVWLEHAPPNEKLYANPLLGVQATGNSNAMRGAWKPLREAGATARIMLVAAATKRWGVDAKSCRTEDGEVIHVPTGRRLKYGEVVADAADMPVPGNVTLKSPGDFKLIGTRAKRLDAPEKVNGTALYGIDARPAGVKIATLAQSPVFGGRVKSVDDTAAKAVKGVRQIVRLDDAVAVVADHMGAAKKGLAALKIEWDDGQHAKLATEEIARKLEQATLGSGAVAQNIGDADKAMASATTKVEASYQVPFLAHATMEPMNCTAHVRADGVDIWAPTQNQTGVQMIGGQIGGVAPEKVAVHTTYLGGGFGRRFELDFIIEALETSKAAGAPVKVIWSREDDIQHAQYRPANYHQLRAGLDASGRPVAWSHRIVAPSIMARMFPQTVKNGLDGEAVEGGVGLPYAIPNVHVDYQLTDTGIPVGFWRSVNNSFNGFAVEGFIDELAAAAKQDPYEYRRALLANAPRDLGVLELAASKAGWGTPLPAGRARGIAVYKSFESFAAEVAEVSVSPEGDVRVHRVVCAIDCGMHVNPSTIEAQMQSGIVYGLTAALKGAIDIEGGRVVQSNFHDYQMLRLAEMPVVEVYIVPSNNEPGGVGEPGTPPIAPAVCNAIFAATGKRIRKLPIGKVT